MSETSLRRIPVPTPRLGERFAPMEGVRVWRNPGNEFVVVEVHYTADPARRGDWKYRVSPKYGGLRSWRWRKEQEIDWTARQGRLVFDLLAEDHYIDPFAVPAHWPRWLLIDPGWNNPSSMLWVAVDVDAEVNEHGFLPLHVYREFYRTRHTSKQLAIAAHEMSLVVSPNGIEELEEIEAVVVDPGAGQEHQSAMSGDPERVSDDAATVLDQLEAAFEEIGGWKAPVETGNNHKAQAIEELIDRTGSYWCDFSGRALYDENEQFRQPTDAELLDGAYRVDPTFFVHKSCPSTWKELRGYRWAEWASTAVDERRNQPEKPVDKDDHSITNLIRFTNLLRDLRGDPTDPHRGFGDLVEFTRRSELRAVVDADAAAEAHHRGRAARFRKRKRGQYGSE